MEVGHSRLLKFFKKDEPKMEQHALEIENLSPSDIESEVPRQQKLRADVPPTSQPDQNGTIEWVDLRDMIKKPVYMGLQEEVIRTPHRIRAPRVGDEVPSVKEEDNTSSEDKPQTRIPVSRFKPVAERVLNEKRDAQDTKVQRSKEAPEKPRRTSIPKPTDRNPVLKKSPIVDDKQADKIENELVKEEKDKTPGKTIERRVLRRDRIPVLRRDHYKITKKDTHVKTPENENERRDVSDDPILDNNNELAKTNDDSLDDEFDKLYEETVDADEISLPVEILEIKVKDPEKLESKFEEIVHQYDEETVEHVKIEPVDKARYSKIPLLRRRSSHDVKVPGQFERRLSLKTGTVKSTEVKDEKMNDSKIREKDRDEQNDIGGGDLVLVSANDTNENAQDDLNIEINNNDEINRYIAAESPHPIPTYNTVPTPDAELVKVGIIGISSRDIPLEENTQSNNVVTPEPETVKVAVINIPSIEPAENISQDLEIAELKPELIHEENTSKVNDETIFFETTVNSRENDDINTLDTEEKAINNDVDDETESIIYGSVNHPEPKLLNSPQPNLLIRNPDEDLKSFGLLKKANVIEERTRSRYIMKPPKDKMKDNNIQIQEKDVPIVKGKVSSILKRLNSQDHFNDDLSNNSADKEVQDVKEETKEIPKKKTVLSKIAMFERADSEPSLKKPIHKYSKPKRTISEEMKHSPKIVQEVLKPKGAEHTDQHTIVTVDIIKPIEVITNNEEQVMVVENLKEESVTYDNLGDGKLNEIDSKPTVIEQSTYGDDKHNGIDNKPIVVEQNDTKLTKKTLHGNHDEYNAQNTSQVNAEANIDLKTTNENQIHNDENLLKSKPKDSDGSKLDKVQANKWKSRESVPNYVPVKEKINRLKSYEATNLKKAKSTAELDLGDAVKGKVKNIIVRMNSFELLDDVKTKEAREVISAKERPRKRSVSEKIALFEKKLTPVAMEEVKLDARAMSLDSKPVKESANSIQVPNEEYADKIKELTAAKLTYGSYANMSFVQLRDGRKMPVLALGTALLEPRLAKHIVAAAIDLGFRAIDTAFIYGTEQGVGEGIRAKIQDGTVRREELFIMSKLWSTFHRPDLVETACRASLAATGLDYFDLYMIHNPMSLKEGPDPLPKIANVLQFSEFDYLDAWFAMEELVSKGLVRSIGVSNFNSVQVARVLEKGRVKPAVNQVECHPYLSQQRLSDFCDARDVRLSCFGILGSKGTPAELKSSQESAIDDPLVQVMAAGLGISPAQLLISYQIQSGHAVVVKASTAAHLWDDLRALNVTLTPAQVTALHALNKNKRTFTYNGMGDTHRNYPFKIPF